MILKVCIKSLLTLLVVSPSLSRIAKQTAVTDRPQGVIIVGIYMSSNILLLLS